jgi:site-specific recombinase XerD
MTGEMTAPDDAALAMLEPLVERARAYAADSVSENTKSAYAADWRTFSTWCDARALPKLPAAPAVVATYLANLADEGRRVSTISRALAGIAYTHRTAGYAWSTKPPITTVMAGIRRRLGVATSKKAPVGDSELRRLVDVLGADLLGLRDRALLTLGWFTACRRSELVALTVADLAPVEQGIIVTVRRSKTDQDGRGEEKGVPYAGDPAVCAVRAVRVWLEASGIAEGPVFRGLVRTGVVAERALSDREVARIVQRAVARAGLPPSAFAGHSLRSGFISTAARRGKSLDSIMRQSGHRSEHVARGYIQHATLFDDNAAAGLL